MGLEKAPLIGYFVHNMNKGLKPLIRETLYYFIWDYKKILDLILTSRWIKVKRLIV